MGTCNSISRPSSNQGPLIARSATNNSRRWKFNQQSNTVRSHSNLRAQMEPQGLNHTLQEEMCINNMKRRRNSMTIAAGSNIKRMQSLSSSSSMFISSPSAAGARSMNLSDEVVSSGTSLSEAPKLSCVSESAAGFPAEGNSSSDTLADTGSASKSVPSLSPSFAEPTVRERLFGTFEHRSAAFKAFYSRPEAFQYELSPFFKTVSKQFHPNMSSNTLEGTVTKQKGFILHSEDIQVPEGDSENQWLGKHVIHFYNSISVFYHRSCRLCTNETCPRMHAGSHVEYKWQNDKGQIKTVSAPKYIRLLFAWIDKQISDPRLFPFRRTEPEQLSESTPCDVLFPKDFRNIASNILRKLWRVIAHLYYGHFKRIKSIGLEDELNFRFYHLAFFVLEFDLVPSAELRPLRSLIVMRLPEDLTVKIDW